MSTKVGIIGLPNVGKSTLFNALTSQTIEVHNYPFTTIQPNIGYALINDSRLTFLSSLFKPKKTTYASLTFFDIAGLVKGASKGEGLGNEFLSHIRECDVLLHVVRVFKNEQIIHVENEINPKNDIEIINLELIYRDLETVEKRLQKIETKAQLAKDKKLLEEVRALHFFKENLLLGKTLRQLDLNDEQKFFARRTLFLLTIKPLLYIANISIDDLFNLEQNTLYQHVLDIALLEKSEVIPLALELEAQLSLLNDVEKEDFMNEWQIKELSLSKIIQSSFRLLNLLTFFTVGEEECRAWTINKQKTAYDGAGLIHSDIQKGFIKAEVYTYNDIVTYKSELAIKEAGKLKIEGRNYLIKDGDVIYYRFR
ncbi:MAG: redox-regulated ATPase YchF [Bacilli bacterium]|jgi:GTP-binding protein YchF|nr:redox-regulated ATPase YchF [Erysipelotrichia bacterium]